MRRLGHLSKPRETRLQRANQDRPVGYRIEWERGVPPSGPTSSRRCATSRSLKPGRCATGASMLPAVWPGDVLSVCRGSSTQALPGDIILFARQGRLFAHRVVEKTTHLFTQAA